ncbi:MAG TPA: hypothetical protein VLA16_07870 [Ideonella sp.]|nr:hypothetical protein [Ideonella sp.]
MVGFVLPPLALWPGPGEGVAAYAAMRALFDTLFLIGSWALGAGALAVAWRAGLSPRWALWALRLAGALALAGGTGGLLGGAAAALAGPAIALSVLALIGVAVSLWPRAALAAPAAGQSPP